MVIEELYSRRRFFYETVEFTSSFLFLIFLTSTICKRNQKKMFRRLYHHFRELADSHCGLYLSDLHCGQFGLKTNPMTKTCAGTTRCEFLTTSSLGFGLQNYGFEFSVWNFKFLVTFLFGFSYIVVQNLKIACSKIFQLTIIFIKFWSERKC